MKRITAALIAAAILMLFSFSPAPLKAERASAAFSVPTIIESESTPLPYYGNFSAPTITARPGETVNISVTLYGNFEAHGLHLWLDYNNSAVTVLSTAYGEVLTQVGSLGGIILLDHTTIPNSIRLGVIMPVDPITANGVIFSAMLTINPDVPDGTVIPLTLKVHEFIYMPIGVTDPPNMSHSVTSGKIIVSESGPTPPPTPRPTSTPGTPTVTPTPTPTSAPVTPTLRPSNAPATPTPRPTNAPVTPTPRPGTTAAPATPTSRPTSAPVTPTPRPGATLIPRPSSAPVTPGNTAAHTPSADPSASIDPFARFGATPFPTIGITPSGGKITPAPDGSAAPDSSADTATPDGALTFDPYARFSPSPIVTLEPAEPSAAPKIGYLVIGSAAALAIAAASVLLVGKRKKRDRDE